MSDSTSYLFHDGVHFDPLSLIDIPSLVASTKEPWVNYTLTQVNDCVIRLGIVKGEFHWHHHDDEDEFFYVVDGQLFIDLEDETVELGPKQGFTVPKTVVHRTRAPQGAVMLMVEGFGS